MREAQRPVEPSWNLRRDVPPDILSARPPCFALLAALLNADRAAASRPGALDVAALARAAAHRLGRSDAIVSVGAAPLGDVDGALYHTGAGGWMLFHDENLEAAEARFVQAWLLGCYALHGRLHLARGEGAPTFECRVSQLYRLADLDSPSARAYSFAARLLMPDPVCRDALPRSVDMEALLAFARHVQVPVWHAARRWIERTAQKAALLLDDGAGVRACWLSETAHGAGLYLDIATASARLGQRPSNGVSGASDVPETSERRLPLSAWFGDAITPAASQPLVDAQVDAQVDETCVAIEGLHPGPHRITLLQLPRGARAPRRHAWGHDRGTMLR